MNDNHYITICKGCNRVMDQCRCPAPKKTIRYALCSECRSKPSEDPKEGFYILKKPGEKDIVVHGYKCSDLGGAFVFGFNTHDGGGLVPLKELTKDTVFILAKVVPTACEYCDPRTIDIGKILEAGIEHCSMCARSLKDPEVVSEVTRLPDGSAFFTAAFPLPKDHWLYKEGDNEPPAPLEIGTEYSTVRKLWKEIIDEVGRFTVRATTANGRIKDFDPDAFLQNLKIGFLGARSDIRSIDDSEKCPHSFEDGVCTLCGKKLFRS